MSSKLTSSLFGGLVIFALLFPGKAAAQTPGADSVVSFEQGANGGFGTDSLPGIVLGDPNGLGKLEGSLDVVSLGDGGRITVSFEDNIIVDGPGPDFTVFENPFYIFGDSLNRYIETAIVEVSSDGVRYARFPFDILPEVEPAGNPHRYVGFAGIEPVLSAGGAPDPTDPLLSGGDRFDLADVGFPNIRYVRLIDTGDDTYDDDGDHVTDTGLHLPPQAGFDLDAICHINWTSGTFPFAVQSATALTPAVIVIDFSKALSEEQEIPPSWFTIDGGPLGEGDEIVRSSGTTLELRLANPLEFINGTHTLRVSQEIESTGGENLLDTYGGEIGSPTAIDGEPDDTERSASSPLPSFPNPFNGSTTIGFEMAEEGYAKVAVYDIRGKQVTILFDGPARRGTHRIVWDGTGKAGETCPSGIYLVELLLGENTHRLKLVHQR